VVNSQVGLWSVPLTDAVVGEKDVTAFRLPNVRALSPRFGGGALFYLSSRDGADGLWTYRNGQALEIWKGSDGVLRVPPAVSADGNSVAIALRRDGKWRMQVIAADGTRLRPLSSDVDVRGAAAWSPDGQWVVVAGSDRDGAGLFKLPAAGGPPVRIASGVFLDPVWSPRGDLIVYCGPQVGGLMPLLGVRPDGVAVPLSAIEIRVDGERLRFLPDGSGLVYMLGPNFERQDFWLLDLGTLQQRRLTDLGNAGDMRTFDVSPDGREIVFDRTRNRSDIRLIDLAARAQH
jgi:Tol biopolymer transport system component